MSTFMFRLEHSKDEAAAVFVREVGTQLQKALVSFKETGDGTQQSIAERLDVDRAELNKWFSGFADLPLSKVAEVCWALGLEPEISLSSTALSEAEQQPVKVKPLDLANLLKHAFLAGAGMNMEPGVIQRIPDELNERYMDYDPSELACYERILAALLPPGGETATPDSEHRQTFTVPHGYEPVFDDTGRATGEIRPALSEKQQ